MVECTAPNTTYLLWSLKPKVKADMRKSLHFRRLPIITNANNWIGGYFNDFCKFCQPVKPIRTKGWLVSSSHSIAEVFNTTTATFIPLQPKYLILYYPPRSPAPIPSTSSMMITRRCCCCCFSFTPPKFNTDVPIIPRSSESSAFTIIRINKQPTGQMRVSCCHHQSSYIDIISPTKHTSLSTNNSKLQKIPNHLVPRI